MALNTKTSVVDYLKSTGKDSSFDTRSSLAKANGINNYTGSASQNTALLKALSTPKVTAPKVTAKPAVVTKTVAPVVTKTTPTAVKTTPTTNATTTAKTTTPTATTPTTSPPTPGLTLEDVSKLISDSNAGLSDSFSSAIGNALGGLNFQDALSQMSGQYDAKMEALQRAMTDQQDMMKKQYEDMMNRFRYTQVQVNPWSLNTNANDGIHLFDPGVGNGNTGVVNPGTPNSDVPGASNGATPVQPGYVQGQSKMNDALFRYLNNLWNGGF